MLCPHPPLIMAEGQAYVLPLPAHASVRYFHVSAHNLPWMKKKRNKLAKNNYHMSIMCCTKCCSLRGQAQSQWWFILYISYIVKVKGVHVRPISLLCLWAFGYLKFNHRPNSCNASLIHYIYLYIVIILDKTL